MYLLLYFENKKNNDVTILYAMEIRVYACTHGKWAGTQANFELDVYRVFEKGSTH